MMLNDTKAGKTTSMASMGLTMALGSIFILGIGIPVTNDVITNGTSNTSDDLTGLTGTVVAFAPVVIAAAYLFLVAKASGILSK